MQTSRQHDDYMDDIMELVFEKVLLDPTPYLEEVDKIHIPPTPSSQHPQQDRFNSGFCRCLLLQSIYCPSSSGNSCLIRRMIQDGSDSLISVCVL
ncbi:hypothetical protein AMECASPLE_007640 [Ameca splendens]|uniref:Uncharacterized protein n=1 Tax=Ameca splendens TaxID=208324 RepID=A0ABV0XCU5_9TELE